MTTTRVPPVVAALVAEFRARTPGSAAAFHRATAVLPGGETRSVTYHPPYPVILAEGHGAELLDADGNTYLDLVNNYTSLIHGNAYPPAVAAASAALAGGAVFPSPHERQLELAELLTSRVPGAERVRFTNSGTEASVLAARLARRATGRTRFLLFDGAYHGSSPPLLAEEPDVVTVPYNDVDAVRDALTDDVAAVFVPDRITEVPAIPRNRTGKKLELPVKKILLGAHPTDVISRDGLADPTALDAFVTYASHAWKGPR